MRPRAGFTSDLLCFGVSFISGERQAGLRQQQVILEAQALSQMTGGDK